MLNGAGLKKVLLATALAGTGYAATPPKYLWRVGIRKPWPIESFFVEASDGTQLSTEDCDGRPVLLVTWAAWCPYMPENLRVVERIKMRYRSTDACIVPVSIDKDKEKAWEFARAQGLVEPYFWGYDGLSDMYWGTTIPHAFVFDRSGRLLLSRDTLAGDYDAVMEAMDTVVHDGEATGSPSPTAPGHGLKPMPEQVETDATYERVRDLVATGDLDRVDAQAVEWRAARARTARDEWKEWILYDELVLDSDAENATDADYEARIARFETWVATRPASVAAKMALARQWFQYAYRARGHGWADSVPKAAWAIFGERMGKARALLDQVEAMPDRSPVVYFSLLGAARAQDRPLAEREALFRKAIAFEPDFFPAYSNHADDFLERWGGSASALRSFVERSADERGGAAGDRLYARLVWHLLDDFEEDRVDPFKTGYSWPRVLAGYRALIAEDPGPERRIQCARLAVLAGDKDVAREMFAGEGVRFQEGTWPTRDAFLGARRWARRPTFWHWLASLVGFGGIA
jgi:hypothetical protein